MAQIGWGVRFGALGLVGLFALSAQAGPVDPARHWPLPPPILETRLAQDRLEILEASGGVGGVMGVKKLKIRLGDPGDVLFVKWKKAPRGDADGWNNTPRKEIAAYEIQKWFLDPENYVVPTITTRCIPFDVYAPLEERPRANLTGTHCVMGALVIWIDNVTVPDTLFDAERFANDPHYARHMADFNVLTYLIEHEDGREGNFLVSEFAEERRIFSIDNGVAFGARMKNFFVPNWHKIRVPALRKESVARLRAVGPEQLTALGVLAELRADAAGIMQPMPHGPNTEPGKGARSQPGWLQLGLEDDEIEDVAERLARLLEKIDSGEIDTY
ncbi:MAG: hypothetical protein JRH16_03185 [Deltaproteobacteria bacterium]|nr:hypothetical protein [Deltaproteobacteria bacterium]MBW2360277.1 hypothetical protein [Deltaproteobacteria bacterium]